MPQTISDLITTARALIKDNREGVTPRHSDAKLIRYLNLALSDARRLRPDLFLPSVATTDVVYTDANLNTVFPLEYSYVTPFVEYMAAMVSLEEDEYVAEGRAQALAARFAAKLLGKVM